MSTAAILSYPTHGHVAPALGVAEELAARGERVVFWATERARQRIEAVGAEFRQYGPDYGRFDPTPPTDGLFSDMVRLASLTEELLPQLVREMEALNPDYVLLDTKSLWGRLLARILDLPAATISVVFAIQSGLVDTGDLVNLLYGQAPRERLFTGLGKLTGYWEVAKRIGARYGVSSPGIIEYLGNPSPLNIIFTSREFQLNANAFDERFQFVGPYVPEGRDCEIDFPWDKLSGEPLIYISLGTTFHNAPEFYAACFQAFAGCPWQVVLSTGGQELDGAPRNFIVRRFVPQLQILRRADLLITHGGMNSVNEGLYFGCPMIVVPQRGDQHLVGARVAELRAGLTVGTPARVTAESLRSAAREIFSNAAFRNKANLLGQSLRNAGGPRRAADVILQYTACNVQSASYA